MIVRVAGILESLDQLSAVVRPESGGMAYEILVPTYVAQRLRERVGHAVSLSTLFYNEAQGQNGSSIPRLIGFDRAPDRRFFELLTSVDGIGNRKCLRAMTREPADIAAAIVRGDIGWLKELPEIGRKTAEKIILELKGKVAPFLGSGGPTAGAGAAPAVAMSAGPANAAIDALMALGEPREDAEMMVRRALAAEPAGDTGGPTVETLIAAAYAARAR